MRRVCFLLCLCLAASAVYSAQTRVFTDAQRSFWSLQPVTKPAIPALKNNQGVKNPIDAFILSKLDEKQLQPNKPADKLTLLRRVTVDLTGLPPTQGEIQSFLSDSSAAAYEKVVDRLLASVWRTLGTPLAGCGALRGQRRIQSGRDAALYLAVPGLCHQSFQRRQAIRQVCARADRRR